MPERGVAEALRIGQALGVDVQLLVVVAIAALLFGGKKIPEFARALGRAKKELEKGLREGDTERRDGDHTAS